MLAASRIDATGGPQAGAGKELHSNRVGPGRILIAGVGYWNLRDMSVGPVLIEHLKRLPWPDYVELEDLSYGPIAVMHNLDDRLPYQRLVLVAGVRRGTKPGQLHCYRWGWEVPEAEEIQARVAEAVTGVISLDNLLIIGTYFRKLPREVVVLEIEAEDQNWGEGFSPAVEQTLPAVIEEIRAQVRHPEWP